MTGREVFSVEVVGGSLTGWVTGSGPPALLLHGGPGLSFDYLDGLAVELEDDFRVAAFQQRGVEPSTLEGPFTISQAIDDVISVLDGLRWERALVVGHSWGGHLGLRVAAAHPERLIGALGVDPIGVVGDGGIDAFEAEMYARTPKADRDRARELDDRAMAGQGPGEEWLESIRLMWHAYFADPQNVPEMPPIKVSVPAYSGVIGEIREGTDEVAAELAKGNVRYGIVAGAASPIPWGQAAQTTVELSSEAFLEVVPAAGHIIWLEAPGRIRGALTRLARMTATE